MTSFLTRALLSTLTLGLLGGAQAQVGQQAAPVLADPLFKDAKSGPAGLYTLPSGVSVILTQGGGYLLSAVVQGKYPAPAAQTPNTQTTTTQPPTTQTPPVPNAAAANASVNQLAAVVGVLSGFGEGMAQPLAQFLNRPDVGPRLAQGININAAPFTITAKTQANVLRLTIKPAQVNPELFAATKNVLPARKATARPVVIRVYSDFQCPYCLQFETQTMPILMAKLPDDVRIEFHQFPLESIHPLARASAEASECAAKQNKFWEYKDLLFKDRSWLSGNPNAVFIKLAGQAGLNADLFTKCLGEGAGRAAVDAGLVEANRLGLNGTPTVFVDGFQVSDVYNPAAYFKLIDFARAVPPAAPATPKKP